MGVQVEETLICSGQGEPLYLWQCPDTIARVALLQNVAQQAARFNQLVPLGNFDRLEIQLAGSRAVAQSKADRMVFVRVSSGNEKSASIRCMSSSPQEKLAPGAVASGLLGLRPAPARCHLPELQLR